MQEIPDITQRADNLKTMFSIIFFQKETKLGFIILAVYKFKFINVGKESRGTLSSCNNLITPQMSAHIHFFPIYF